jgi:Transglycosylase SLT domain
LDDLSNSWNVVNPLPDPFLADGVEKVLAAVGANFLRAADALKAGRHGGPLNLDRIFQRPSSSHEECILRKNQPTIPVSSPRTAKSSSSRKTHVRRSRNRFLPRLRRWRGARWARRKLTTAPRAVGIVGVVASLLAAFSLTNLAYHVVHKPTELFFFVGGALDKKPSETWRQYGPLFRAYSTSTITPELLAALAQVESTGNPVARTYWRWQLSWNPLAVYQPASSAVGLYQMTDAAYAEAARSCIRKNAVVDGDCGFTSLYIRAIPSHAIELASVYLDRNVAAVLARAPDVTASPQQKQDLAAFIHLCGAGPTTAFARRNFQMMAGERCGDHLVAAYVARVNAMKREFLRLAADGRNKLAGRIGVAIGR